MWSIYQRPHTGFRYFTKRSFSIWHGPGKIIIIIHKIHPHLLFFHLLKSKCIWYSYFGGTIISKINLTQKLPSVQLSSVTQSCPTLCNSMNCSTPGLPVHHQLPEFTQTHVHQDGDAIQPSHPLSSPFPPAPNPSQLYAKSALTIILPQLPLGSVFVWNCKFHGAFCFSWRNSISPLILKPNLVNRVVKILFLLQIGLAYKIC